MKFCQEAVPLHLMIEQLYQDKPLLIQAVMTEFGHKETRINDLECKMAELEKKIAREKNENKSSGSKHGHTYLQEVFLDCIFSILT
jgi:hypothetical protein